MMKNLHEGSADLIVAGYSATRLRRDFVDFLPVYGGYKYAIYIKKQFIEEFSWTTFTKPFSNELWLVICIIAMLYAFLLLFGTTHQDKECSARSLSQYVGWFWITLTANFGRKPCNSAWMTKTCTRVVMVTCLFGGNIIWIAYRASFTSELSAKKITLPFDSLEGLANSDYK